jgi:hypothetical protein
MRASIESYFRFLQRVIADAPHVSASEVNFETRGARVGFVRGILYFVDGSTLHFRELVDVRSASERSMYVYHYQGADGTLAFRYDNTRHFPHLPNFPHHKHVGDEKNVLSDQAPDLTVVLTEIERLLPQLTADMEPE